MIMGSHFGKVDRKNIQIVLAFHRTLRGLNVGGGKYIM